MLLIGIGAGDPEYVTQQAIRALNEVDVFFVMEKGEEKDDLVALRREVCERFIDEQSYRIVAARDPERDRTAAAYASAVDDWRRARAEIWERWIADELDDAGVGAILVWGDPSLYDSTLTIMDAIRAAGRVQFGIEVIPGISAVAALCARHAITLNRVGEAVHITTGRRLAREGFPANAPDVVVMLDAHCAFQALRDAAVEIYWGAYLGTPDEILIAGAVGDVADEIVRVRAAARERKGWIMDTYLPRAARRAAACPAAHALRCRAGAARSTRRRPCRRGRGGCARRSSRRCS
jgi:precorrin-6A synthase